MTFKKPTFLIRALEIKRTKSQLYMDFVIVPCLIVERLRWLMKVQDTLALAQLWHA